MPLPRAMVLLPLPAWTLSLPSPSATVLTPVPAWMLSLPLPSVTLLLPLPRWTLSLPLPAVMVLAPLPAWTLSLPLPSVTLLLPLPSWTVLLPLPSLTLAAMVKVAGELNVIVAAEADDVEGSKGLAVSTRRGAAVEMGDDLDSGAAGVAAAGGVDLDVVIAGAAADEVQGVADDGQAGTNDRLWLASSWGCSRYYYFCRRYSWPPTGRCRECWAHSRWAWRRCRCR